MPRIGRFTSVPPMPARCVTGMVLAAMIVVLLHGSASAQQAGGPGQRRKRTDNHAVGRGAAGRTRGSAGSRAAAPPADPAAAKARELMRSIDWQQAPEIAGLGTIAEFRIPRNYLFTAARGSKAFLEVTRYPAPKELLGVLVPYGSYEWFVVFESKEGIQKDDGNGNENGKGPKAVDAAALLKELRAENEAENATRRARGWAERTGLDFERPPSRDDRSGNLTWTTKSNYAGRRVVRTTTRIFGKRGAIDAHLVASEQNLATAGNTFTNFLTLVEFTDGPNGGMRRDDLGGGNGGSSGTTTAGATYVPTSTYTYSAGSTTRSIARSPRTIGGFFTAVAGGVGAAFRKKKRASS